MTYPANGAIAGAVEIPRLAWRSPLGVEYPLDLGALNTAGMIALVGVQGLGAAPRQITADPHPRGGTRVRRIHPGPRTVTLPLYIEGSSDTQFRERWWGLADGFGQTRLHGPGQLISIRPDGRRRLTDAYYQDGFEPNPDMPPMRDVVALTLYCPSPWWRDPDPTLIARAYAAAGSSFFNPFPTVSSSQALGATTAFNPGGVEAWPIWTIRGPAGSLTATNDTTGESFSLDAQAFRGSALTGAETVTIYTDPPQVIGPDGSNWTEALNWPGASLWHLEPGDNAVTFAAGGAGAGTSIEASFYAQYESA